MRNSEPPHDHAVLLYVVAAATIAYGVVAGLVAVDPAVAVAVVAGLTAALVILTGVLVWIGLRPPTQ